MSASRYVLIGEVDAVGERYRLYKGEGERFALFKLNAQGLPEQKPSYEGTLTTLCVRVAAMLVNEAFKISKQERKSHDKKRV